jgi:hypothetical protein
MSKHQPWESDFTIRYLDLFSAVEIASLIDDMGRMGEEATLFHEAGLWDLKVVREPTPPAASGPFIDFAYLVLVFAGATGAAVAAGFLEEIGRDIYRGIRRHLHRLYTKAADTGLRHAFRIETNVHGVPVYFQILNAHGTGSRLLTEEEFTHALSAAKKIIESDTFYRGVPRDSRFTWVYVVTWEPTTNAWKAEGFWKSGFGANGSASDL